MNIQMKQTRRSSSSKTVYFYVTADNEKAINRAVKRIIKVANPVEVYNLKENFGSVDGVSAPVYLNTTFTVKARVE